MQSHIFIENVFIRKCNFRTQFRFKLLYRVSINDTNVQHFSYSFTDFFVLIFIRILTSYFKGNYLNCSFDHVSNSVLE